MCFVFYLWGGGVRCNYIKATDVATCKNVMYCGQLEHINAKIDHMQNDTRGTEGERGWLDLNFGEK